MIKIVANASLKLGLYRIWEKYMLFSVNHEKGSVLSEGMKNHTGFSTMTRTPWVREEGIVLELPPHHNQSGR